MNTQKLFFTNDVSSQLDTTIKEINPGSIFILVDRNTAECVLPKIQATCSTIADSPVITIEPGDINKSIDTLAHVWKQLGDMGATRSSLLINIGGGMVTDLGAFAASTFKRGIRFLNVPTTLLAAVDASVGGKTGINFNGLKNEVGTFSEAYAVIISTTFFNTLPPYELKSGYAEMIKHSLLTSTVEFNTLTAEDITAVSPDRLLDLLKKSVEVKRRVVAEDPHEHGLRRSLNLGHTVGHAFETMALERQSPIPHGYAVAYGLIVSLVLSHMKLNFPTEPLYRLANYVLDNYGAFAITCDDYPHMLELMGHDKKNDRPGRVLFTLLHDIGKVECGIEIAPDDITAALDIYRDLLHLQ